MSLLVPKLSTVARMRPRSWWRQGLTLEVRIKIYQEWAAVLLLLKNVWNRIPKSCFFQARSLWRGPRAGPAAR